MNLKQTLGRTQLVHVPSSSSPLRQQIFISQVVVRQHHACFCEVYAPLQPTDSTAGRPGDSTPFRTRPSPLAPRICGRAEKTTVVGSELLSTVAIIAIAAGLGSAVLLAALAIWWWLRAPKLPRSARQANRAFAQATTIKETTPSMGIVGKQVRHISSETERQNHMHWVCLP